MADISKELIEQLVKQVVLEKMGQSSKHVDPSGILSVKLPVVKVSEED
ncbi:ethanolamine utilization protein EutQ, partial [Escherichia coli]|nr:ethanolamine utilization protein EutQ [Escherichia coli]